MLGARVLGAQVLGEVGELEEVGEEEEQEQEEEQEEVGEVGETTGREVWAGLTKEKFQERQFMSNKHSFDKLCTYHHEKNNPNMHIYALKRKVVTSSKTLGQ